jgi:hypothetical protein
VDLAVILIIVPYIYSAIALINLLAIHQLPQTSGFQLPLVRSRRCSTACGP